jgi:type II secretory pathway pseudopilin PulG
VIEVALLLSLLSVVLAVFVPTFLRRVRTNKVNEASELLQAISHRTRAYYETAWSSSERHCLPKAAGPTPPTPTVDPQDVDFFSPEEPGSPTWRALDFQPDRPVRFSYSFVPNRDGCLLDEAGDSVAVVLRAQGDLDGDGVRSTFEHRAVVDRDGFTPAEALLVHQRTE